MTLFLLLSNGHDRELERSDVLPICRKRANEPHDPSFCLFPRFRTNSVFLFLLARSLTSRIPSATKQSTTCLPEPVLRPSSDINVRPYLTRIYRADERPEESPTAFLQLARRNFNYNRRSSHYGHHESLLSPKGCLRSSAVHNANREWTLGTCNVFV